MSRAFDSLVKVKKPKDSDMLVRVPQFGRAGRNCVGRTSFGQGRSNRFRLDLFTSRGRLTGRVYHWGCTSPPGQGVRWCESELSVIPFWGVWDLGRTRAFEKWTAWQRVEPLAESGIS